MFKNTNSTILIFDSGIGGLSIYKKIYFLFPNFHYVYVFDNVAFPYGEKSEKFITNRTIKIISAIKNQYQLSLIIIACNTISTISLHLLQKNTVTPVIGVVPEIRLATHLTINNIIGLIATKRTINSNYIKKTISNYSNKYKIRKLSSARLVELAEIKFRGEEISIEEIRYILRPLICVPNPPDTIVLGCTHFFFLKKELTAVLPKNTHLVDSSELVSEHTSLIFKYQKKTRNKNKLKLLNNAFCMKFTIQTSYLLPILQKYGFKTLEKLSI